MSWRNLWISIAMATAWTCAALYVVRGAPSIATPPRTFLAEMGSNEYRVSADDVRVEGFCTIFLLDGQRIAAVCGQHTWSETREAK